MFNNLLTNFVTKRSNKQARLQILKLGACLIALSVCLILYSQYLIHNRCNNLDCKSENDILVIEKDYEANIAGKS